MNVTGNESSWERMAAVVKRGLYGPEYRCQMELLLPSLSTRIVPLRFQAGGCRRRPNLGLVCVLLCNLCYLYSLVKMDCGVLFYLVKFSLVLCVPSVL